jgi:hypothetical protein
MTKQLNVRSDKARTTAKKIAARLKGTNTEVVVGALRRFDGQTARLPTYEELKGEPRRFADRLLALARAGRREGDADASSDHSWLYDEYGAPK